MDAGCEDVEVPLGEYHWNWLSGEFHCERQGRGTISTWIDGDGEAYDLNELDEDVEPVLAVVELHEGIFAGRFITIDVADDEHTERRRLN